jgi:hypothetical protein
VISWGGVWLASVVAELFACLRVDALSTWQVVKPIIETSDVALPVVHDNGVEL